MESGDSPADIGLPCNLCAEIEMSEEVSLRKMKIIRRDTEVFSNVEESSISEKNISYAVFFYKMFPGKHFNPSCPSTRKMINFLVGNVSRETK